MVGSFSRRKVRLHGVGGCASGILSLFQLFYLQQERDTSCPSCAIQPVLHTMGDGLKWSLNTYALPAIFKLRWLLFKTKFSMQPSTKHKNCNDNFPHRFLQFLLKSYEILIKDAFTKNIEDLRTFLLYIIL